jgi:hypothetical protein
VSKTRSLALCTWRLSALEPLLDDQSEHILATYSHASSEGRDLVVIQRLVESMKDVGIKADNERRQRVEQLLKSVPAGERKTLVVITAGLPL